VAQQQQQHPEEQQLSPGERQQDKQRRYQQQHRLGIYFEPQTHAEAVEHLEHQRRWELLDQEYEAVMRNRQQQQQQQQQQLLQAERQQQQQQSTNDMDADVSEWRDRTATIFNEHSIAGRYTKRKAMLPQCRNQN
jgi:hypothetical protein